MCEPTRCRIDLSRIRIDCHVVPSCVVRLLFERVRNDPDVGQITIVPEEPDLPLLYTGLKTFRNRYLPSSCLIDREATFSGIIDAVGDGSEFQKSTVSIGDADYLVINKPMLRHAKVEDEDVVSFRVTLVRAF